MADLLPLPAPFPSTAAPPQELRFYRAADLRVTLGTNFGDGLDAGAACPGDVHTLVPAARPLRMRVQPTPAGLVIAQDSPAGPAGAVLRPLRRLMMMTADGRTLELLLLRPVAEGGTPGPWLLLAEAEIAPRCGYVLIHAEPAAEAPLGAPAGLCLGPDTRIALPSGELAPLGGLSPGDLVLTRDRGPQPLRWIGRVTLRATGAAAPVAIARGALGNAADLLVGQHHRLMLYRRDRQPGQCAAEQLVPARDLVDGATIRLREGGHAEYICPLLDRHEILYAEGIPVETLQVGPATLPALPEDLRAEIRRWFPTLAQEPHFATEMPGEAADPDPDRVGRDRPLPVPGVSGPVARPAYRSDSTAASARCSSAVSAEAIRFIGE